MAGEEVNQLGQKRLLLLLVFVADARALNLKVKAVKRQWLRISEGMQPFCRLFDVAYWTSFYVTWILKYGIY